MSTFTLFAKKYFLLAFLSFNCFIGLLAQTKTWTGIAADGKWETAINWSGNSVPSETDNVVLDNSLLPGSYTVQLPDIFLKIKTITISPIIGNKIELVLPTTNALIPGISITGETNGLVINDGGVFRNSSGATVSGYPIDISTKIRINNGGKYIHNTERSHANNLALLSKEPGTEFGAFEFDVPGTKSYTLSIPNRTYGTLIISANAAGGQRSYLSTGINPLTVNGNMQINEGVNYNMQVGGPIGNLNIKGDFIQNGGLLNLSSGVNNSTIVMVAGNIYQAAGSEIRATNSGPRIIELNGDKAQNIKMNGTVSTGVSFRINNPAGTILQAPLLLPYHLELVKGNIKTSTENLLTLEPDCGILVDSSSANQGFIDGPMRKEGLSGTDHYLFPVGKGNEFRWVELKNATGNFIVEYLEGDPRFLSNTYGSGIHHISPKGYWAIEADASPSAAAKVELSWSALGGTGITDMASLRTSQLVSGIWVDRNNSSTTGSPGSSGSVVGELITGFNTTAKHFVLASSTADQNPLPIVLLDFTGLRLNGNTRLDWRINEALDLDYFEILGGYDIDDLKIMDKIAGVSTKKQYDFIDTSPLSATKYYQLRITEKSGNSFLSKTIAINDFSRNIPWVSIAPSLVESSAEMIVNAPMDGAYQFIVSSMEGRIVKKIFINLPKGRSIVPIDLERLASGLYHLLGHSPKGQKAVVRFIKK